MSGWVEFDDHATPAHSAAAIDRLTDGRTTFGEAVEGCGASAVARRLFPLVLSAPALLHHHDYSVPGEEDEGGGEMMGRRGSEARGRGNLRRPGFRYCLSAFGESKAGEAGE